MQGLAKPEGAQTWWICTPNLDQTPPSTCTQTRSESAGRHTGPHRMWSAQIP